MKRSIQFAFLMTLLLLPCKGFAIYKRALDPSVLPLEKKETVVHRFNNWQTKWVYAFGQKKIGKTPFITEGGKKKAFDSYAVISFILACVVLMGILISKFNVVFIFSILSLLFGIIGLVRIFKKPQERGGLGFALVGLILGSMLMGVLILSLLSLL